MASFRAAAAALLAAASALPGSRGFAASRRPARPASSPLRATETFQRTLLESQLANANANGAAPAANGAAAPPAAEDTTTEFPAEEPSASAPAPPPSELENAAALYALLRVAAATDRGQFASPSQKESVVAQVALLEDNAPAHDDDEEGGGAPIPPRLAGTWELLYSDTQLFRSSPFFLAGRATCATEEQAAQYDWFCAMHRAALAISTIGPVRQVIASTGRIVNEFEVKAGAVPFLSDFLPQLRYSGGLPLTIDGAIVSSADATPVESDAETETAWELFMDTVEIKGSNLPLLRRILDADGVALRSRDLSKVLEDNLSAYEVPKPRLRTTYVDARTRIVRDQDDHVFVYGRVSASEEPTDYKGVMPDLGVGGLLEGFNDAVSKIYL